MRHYDPFTRIALGNEFTLPPAGMNVPPGPRGEPHLNNHRGEIIPFRAWPSDHYSVLALRDRLRRIG